MGDDSKIVQNRKFYLGWSILIDHVEFVPGSFRFPLHKVCRTYSVDRILIYKTVSAFLGTACRFKKVGCCLLIISFGPVDFSFKDFYTVIKTWSTSRHDESKADHGHGRKNFPFSAGNIKFSKKNRHEKKDDRKDYENPVPVYGLDLIGNSIAFCIPRNKFQNFCGRPHFRSINIFAL